MDVCLFPGQGSQIRGMGRELFDQVPEYLEVEPELDRMLGYSVRHVCIHDEQNWLQHTQYTQPCLYIVNALYYFSAVEERGEPDLLAGHSLGEYNALLAAGAFDLMTGARLVQKRAELMSGAEGGGMLAVIGLEVGRVRKALEEAGLHEIDLANLNAPTQIVVSGKQRDLDDAKLALQRAGARGCIPLPVSGAFHSRYMADAARRFETFLASMRFSEPKIPVVANVTAEPYPAGSAALVAPTLVSQLTQPVQWAASIRCLLSMGATSFREVGPGTVLSRLLKADPTTAPLVREAACTSR